MTDLDRLRHALALADAINGQAIVCGSAMQAYGMAALDGTSGAERHRLLDETDQAYRELLRLTRALAEFAAGEVAR